MTPYLAVLFFVVGIAYVGRISRHKPTQQLSLWIVTFLLVAFAGLRDKSVGTDTGNYVRMLLRVDGVSYITQSTEVGYNVLTWVAVTLSESYSVLLVLIAVIVVRCYLSAIVRLTHRYEVGLFVFICLGIYTFFLGRDRASRQRYASQRSPFCLNEEPFCTSSQWG